MSIRRAFVTTIVALPGLLAGPLSSPAMAHCDSMDGPVVRDAQRAIVEEDVTPVLKWVTQKDKLGFCLVFASILGIAVAARA